MPFKFKKGFSLIEILVVVAIFGLIMISVSKFSADVFSLGGTVRDSLSSAQDARALLKTIAREIRMASSANNGSFTIDSASTSTFSFYSDIDDDGNKEKVRYFLSGNILKKGVIKPSGNPVVYNSSGESVSILVNNIKNATSSIFEYFDSNYDGISSPLSIPVNLSTIRLVKITLKIDADPNRAPLIRTYTTQVSFRNLKDNL